MISRVTKLNKTETKNSYFSISVDMHKYGIKVYRAPIDNLFYFYNLSSGNRWIVDSYCKTHNIKTFYFLGALSFQLED